MIGGSASSVNDCRGSRAAANRVLAFVPVVRYGSQLPGTSCAKPKEGRLPLKKNVWCFLLAAIPFLTICFSVPLWDRVYPLVFGFPFNFFWLIACIPLTSLCLFAIYRLQKSHNPDKGEPR